MIFNLFSYAILLPSVTNYCTSAQTNKTCIEHYAPRLCYMCYNILDSWVVFYLVYRSNNLAYLLNNGLKKCV